MGRRRLFTLRMGLLAALFGLAILAMGLGVASCGGDLKTGIWIRIMQSLSSRSGISIPAAS